MTLANKTILIIIFITNIFTLVGVQSQSYSQDWGNQIDSNKNNQDWSSTNDFSNTDNNIINNNSNFDIITTDSITTDSIITGSIDSSAITDESKFIGKYVIDAYASKSRFNTEKFMDEVLLLNKDIIGKSQTHIVATKNNGKTIYHFYLGGFSIVNKAHDFCNVLKRRGINCIVKKIHSNIN